MGGRVEIHANSHQDAAVKPLFNSEELSPVQFRFFPNKIIDTNKAFVIAKTDLHTGTYEYNYSTLFLYEVES